MEQAKTLHPYGNILGVCQSMSDMDRDFCSECLLQQKIMGVQTKAMGGGFQNNV